MAPSGPPDDASPRAASERQATTCRRIVVAHHGGPDVLRFVEAPRPAPGPGQLRVQTLAAGVSAVDLMVRRSGFPGFPRVPFTPGVDVVGIVDAVGPGTVTDLRPGQTVACLLGFEGGYAEFVCLPAREAVPVPAGLDPGEAVCMVANYLTAYAMLHRGAQLQPGERILVHGAAGGVGTALLELGRLAGATLFGTASPLNHDLVRRLGATPIDYRADDFVAALRALTGDGVDAVFDPIGGARQLWRSYRCLRRGGRLIWFGVAATAKRGRRVIPESLLARAVLDALPDGRRAPMPPDAKGPIDVYRRTLATLFDLLAGGKLKPVIAARIPLADAARAHACLERGGYAGKVVLVTR